MPNLDHDAQNPTDLMDRPIAEGDIVAWGTTYGRSPALCVARIHKIRFIQRGKHGIHNIEVEQALADDYQLILEPIKSTGSVTNSTFRRDPVDGRWKSFPLEKPKLKTIHLVKNIVKLEPLV